MQRISGGPRMRQPPQLRATSAALICHFLAVVGQVTAAGGVSDLSDGQIAGVVIGSVGGALLLGLLTVLVCCLRASWRRQTGDLTWAKSGDVEATAIDRTPHQPLSGPCAEDLAAESARRRGGAGGLDADASFHGNACRTDTSTVTGEGQSGAAYEGGGIDPSAFPNFPPSPPSPVAGGGRKLGFFRGRSLAASVGSSVGQLFVAHKGLLRNNSEGVKDKHLQVSRSARVEPSAEVEMAAPFQPAATNMGPPLSKSSMLMRWLNGADEGLPEAAVAAAQLAAASDGASGRSGGKGAAARGGSGRSGAAGVGMSLDRLPLLSLAAQQTGIVWSKMPPSVASSPAVSIVESSSMFMLKGTMKRSDAVDDAASSAAHGHSHTLTHAAAALAAWNGGDDHYPASLAQASLDSFSLDRDSVANSAAQRRGGAASASAAGSAAGGGGTGIVFNYVMRSSPGPPSGRTTAIAGGAASRATPMRDGAVLPVSSSGGGADPTARHHLGFEADDAFAVGVLQDEQVLAQAQALSRAPPSPVQDSTAAAAAPRASSARPWLHQVPAMKLTSLQEEGEGEEGVPLPPAQPTYKQLLPMPPTPPTLGMAVAGLPLPLAQGQELNVTHGSAQIAVPSWTQFGDSAGFSATAAGGGFSQGALVSGPLASSHLSPEPPLPLAAAARPFGSPAAAVLAITAADVGMAQTAAPFQMQSRSGDSAYGCAPASEFAAGIPGSGGAADGGGGSAFISPGRAPPDVTVAAAAAPGGAPWASPRTSASNLQRRVGAPSPLALHTLSQTSLRSQTSLASPSMGMHYPGMPGALAAQRQGSGADGCISEGVTPRGGGAAAAAADAPALLRGGSSGPPSRDAADRELPLPVSVAASDPL